MVFVLHRRSGKTEISLKKLVNAAVKNTLDLPVYFYVAPLLKQAKTIAWTRLKQMLVKFIISGACEVNESDLYIKFKHNGAVLRLYGADNPDAMRGVRLDGCVVDEVAQIKPEVWEEIIRPALADRNGWCWFLGTPKGINLFSILYHSAQTKPDWATARYTVYDTDALPEVEITRLKREMSEQAFAREFLCDFSASGDDQLLSLTDIEVAAQRIYQENEFNGAPVILGVDPARFGNDRSVIIRRQGLQVFDPIVVHGIDNMDFAGRVSVQIDKYQPDAVFIDIGQGAGIIDRLRQLGYDVIEVNFGGKSGSPLYVNKRTEMWHKMADAVRAGLALPNNNSLKVELATPTYSFDVSNKIKLESKDEIKKRMPEGISPDIADALALTYAQTVHKRKPFQAKASAKDYDPYAQVRATG
jgi:hypothetical protein